MGKQSRVRAQGRARLAEVRAAQARQERNRRLLTAVAAIVGVLVIAGGIVALGMAGGKKDSSGGPATTASPEVVAAVTSVPASVLDAVGVGDVNAVPKAISAPALTADGKPRVLYVGAEYCPYCAAQRWGMVVALSRFGTWSGLGQTHSSSSDVFPNTATLSFHGATFTSKYISFTGYETATNKQVGGQYEPLDTLSAEDEQIFTTYDQPPYVDSKGGIPFIDIGGAWALSGSSFSPQALAGKTHQQIATALSDPTSPIAKAVDGTANAMTAAICAVTNDKPASVCNSSGVKAAAAGLSGGQ